MYLRALDPQTEGALFREAYQWRKSPRRDRVAFEVFAADDPRQIVMGLFDGKDFLAVYVFYQISSDTFDCHYTCRRDALKDAVLAAGRQLVTFFVENNLKLSTFVTRRNKPLRRWVEAVGLICVTGENKCCKVTQGGDIVSATSKPLLEYRSQQVNPNRVERQKTDEYGHVRDDGFLRLQNAPNDSGAR